MKRKLKTQLQQFGIFAQLIPEIKIQFFPTPKSLYKYLLKQNRKEQISEFKRLTDFIADAQNQPYYQGLLSKIYPELPEIEESSFVSKKSRNSRNRKIISDNKIYFEKNYFHSGHELESILSLDEVLYSFLNRYFKIPKVLKHFKGDFTDLLFFEYLELSPINQEHTEEILIQTAIKLYEISIKEQEALKKIKWKPILLNFEKLFFEENINVAKKDLIRQNINPEEIWKKVLDATYVLTHGDLHAENVYEHQHLIDLDNLGFYPLGLDAAFIFMYYFEEQDFKRSFSEWIQLHFSKRIYPQHLDEFERNAVFYGFLFFHMRKDKEKHKDFYEDLIRDLKNLFLFKK